MKLPPWWPPATSDISPKVWFALAESQFHLHGVTSEQTKFHHVLGVLDLATVRELSDVLSNPSSAPFTQLRDEIIRRFSVSTESRIHQLLHQEEIGDRTPSSFLRHLRKLGGQEVQDSLLRTIWASRLPQQIQAIIAGQDAIQLDDIAVLADKIAEATRPTRLAAAVAAPTCSAAASQPPDKMTEMMALLTDVLKRLPVAADSAGPSSQRRRARSSSRDRSNSRPRTQPRSDLCFYHQRFGKNAKKCSPPCQWGNANSNR